MQTPKIPGAVEGKVPSVRETEAAFAKFEKHLTERQRQIIYNTLLSQDIDRFWTVATLDSEKYLGSFSHSPTMHQRTQASRNLHTLVGGWRHRVEENAMRKNDKSIEQDRAYLAELREKGVLPR